MPSRKSIKKGATEKKSTSENLSLVKNLKTKYLTKNT